MYLAAAGTPPRRPTAEQRPPGRRAAETRLLRLSAAVRPLGTLCKSPFRRAGHRLASGGRHPVRCALRLRPGRHQETGGVHSSVSHLGYCMLGLFAANETGLTGSLLQMINHGLSTGGLFLLVGMLYEQLYHARQMADYGGMATKLKMLAFLMVFMGMSSVAALAGTERLLGRVRGHVGHVQLRRYGGVEGQPAGLPGVRRRGARRGCTR